MLAAAGPLCHSSSHGNGVGRGKKQRQEVGREPVLVTPNTARLEPHFLCSYMGSVGKSLSVLLCHSSHSLDDLPARRAGATVLSLHQDPDPAHLERCSVLSVLRLPTGEETDRQGTAEENEQGFWTPVRLRNVLKNRKMALTASLIVLCNLNSMK